MKRNMSFSFALQIFYVFITFGEISTLTTLTGECSNEKGCSRFTCPTLGQNCVLRICTQLKTGIACKQGVIKMYSTWFGRTQKDICGTNDTGDCDPGPSLKQKQIDNGNRMCNNETICILKASFDFEDTCGTVLWGDPCSNIPKYLVLNFTCVAKVLIDHWSDWSSWSSCSTSCSTGKTLRQRDCVDPPGKECYCKTKKIRPEKETKPCNTGKICEVSTSVPGTPTIMESTPIPDVSMISTIVKESAGVTEILESNKLVSTEAPVVSEIPESTKVLVSTATPDFSKTLESTELLETTALPNFTEILVSSAVHYSTVIPNFSKMQSSAKTVIPSKVTSENVESSFQFKTAMMSASLTKSEQSTYSENFSVEPTDKLSPTMDVSHIVPAIESSKVVSNEASQPLTKLPVITTTVRSTRLNTNLKSSFSMKRLISDIKTQLVSSNLKHVSTSTKIISSRCSSFQSSIKKTQILSQISSLTQKTFSPSTKHITAIKKSSSSLVKHSSSSKKINPSTIVSSSSIASSSLIVIPITNPPIVTTESPIKPDHYVKIVLTLLWKDFCKKIDEFTDIMATIVSKKIVTSQSQVMITNLHNCKSKADENAIVKLYISVENSKEPSESLTKILIAELEKLFVGGSSASLGGSFGNGTITGVLMVVNPGNNNKDDDWPLWLIILVAIAAAIFLLWMLCCLYIFCRRKKRQKATRKYTCTPVQPVHVKLSEDNDADSLDNSKTYTSSLKVTVRPKSPVVDPGKDNTGFEMQDIPLSPNNTFKPVSVHLINHTPKDETDNPNTVTLLIPNETSVDEKKDDTSSSSDSSDDDEEKLPPPPSHDTSSKSSNDDEKKAATPPSTPPTPKTNKVYLDGELIQEFEPIIIKTSKI